MVVVSRLFGASTGHSPMETHYVHKFMVLFQVLSHVKIIQEIHEKSQSWFNIYSNACDKVQMIHVQLLSKHPISGM